jgi:hypothetical protein
MKHLDNKLSSSPVTSLPTSNEPGGGGIKPSIPNRLFGGERSRMIGQHSITAIMNRGCVTDLTFQIGRQLKGE